MNLLELAGNLSEEYDFAVFTGFGFKIMLFALKKRHTPTPSQEKNTTP